LIAIDTSALVAILLEEPAADQCRAVVEAENAVLVSAGTVLEALIVASGRGFQAEMQRFLSAPGMTVIPVTAARAELAARAYRQWGRNFHKAALNFGDCFSYATAREFDCPLLFIGRDFPQTDITPAISVPHP
jgi:ribonuclease VapC